MIDNSKEYIDLWGFDIDKKSTSTYATISNCWGNKKLTDLTERLAREVLELFEDDSGKQYEFVSLVKAAWNISLEYYLTFTATQKDDPHVLQTIQAVVRSADYLPHFMFCRIKPAVAHPPKPFRRFVRRPSRAKQIPANCRVKPPVPQITKPFRRRIRPHRAK